MRANKLSVKALPALPGVYLFKDAAGKVIYVGKGKNLVSRVSSYFMVDLEPKTARMVSQAKDLDYTVVESEFEALLLEAKLVNRYKPKYNIQLRDDKSPLYIGITKEELPRIVLFRHRELEKYRLSRIYGPFINSASPKKVLRLTRKIFPFSTHKPARRVCIYHQIGLCSPCPSEVQKKPDLKKDYLLNIRRVNAVLSGKSKFLVKQLEAEMRNFAKAEHYEKAYEAKRKLGELIYTTTRQELNEGYLDNPNLLEDIRNKELTELFKLINKYLPIRQVSRIECYDVAHLAGTFPTASMVTFINGEPDKSLYRHFKMHHKNSDIDNMKEVLKRRYSGKKGWGSPDLVIVDGGKAQLAAALDVVKNLPVVGLAKREETLVFMTPGGFCEVRLPEGSAKKLVQRIRDEAHRFARSYHHKLVSRAIIKA